MPFRRDSRPPKAKLYAKLKRVYGRRSAVAPHHIGGIIVAALSHRSSVELGLEATAAVVEIFLRVYGDPVVVGFLDANPRWVADTVVRLCRVSRSVSADDTQVDGGAV